jgi:hypothetical protein
MTIASRIKKFNRSLKLDAALPSCVAVMNPYRESPLALACGDAFYEKFYNDDSMRLMILGINPGRFGSGLTGVAFTDFKRLRDACGIDPQGQTSHEPSSEFIYRMIAAMGGVDAFYSRFYINSVCPLGFVISRQPGRWVNYNYYDDLALFEAVKPFIIESLWQQIAICGRRDVCFCMGVKNHHYFTQLNDVHQFFDRIIMLPHPRYIVQYRKRDMDEFIAQYVAAFLSLDTGSVK